MLSLNAYPVNPTQVCVRMLATAAVAATAATVEPVHFIAAIDVSESMLQNRQLDNVITSLKFLLDYMKAEDALSVITFGTDAEIVLRQVRTTSEHKDMIRFRLSQLTPHGMTNLSAVFSYIPELLMTGYKQGLLILTDGEVNVGVTDSTVLTRMAESLGGDVSLTMVGYGPQHNTALCRAMAAATSGTYDVVNTLENVASVFGNTLGGLVTCAYQQVRFQLPPGVIQRSAFPVRSDGTLFVGDLQEDNEVILLLENVDPTVPLIVRGRHVASGRDCEVTVTVRTDPTPEEVMVGLVTSLRFRVVALLEEVLRFGRRPDERAAECAELRRLLTDVSAAATTATSTSLVALLLAEVERCERLGAMPTRHETSILSQRTAYLGLGRGVLSPDADDDPTAVLYSSASPSASAEADAEEPPRTPPPRAPVLDRSFSNPAQRAMSDAMRSASSAYQTSPPPRMATLGRSPSMSSPFP
jgi:hypothetical protein